MNALDTNVWLYSHDASDPRKQAIAQQLVATVRPLALPWQVGCEFIAASRKLAVVGFTAAHAWDASGYGLSPLFSLSKDGPVKNSIRAPAAAASFAPRRS